MCLDGRYPALCNHQLLSPDQARRVDAAERVNATRQAQRPLPRRSGPIGRATCESGHWIESVSNDGEIIKLEDGSIWEVDAGDTVDSMLWLPVTNIVVCPDKLINIDDNETVGVTQLH